MRLQKRFGFFIGAAVAIASASTASAFTTSLGQIWDTEPDAWVRGNTADASWFGWDDFEGGIPGPAPFGPPLGELLDDSTPDIGGATTASSPLIKQSDASALVYGHVSSSGNFYSGFLGNAFADGTISGVAPASGSGGYTTLLLQVLAQPGTLVSDLSFTADPAWTKTSDLFNTIGDSTGRYWQEWTAPGDNVPFSIDYASVFSSRSVDAFQVDTYWTPGAAPVVNSRTAIPEPASLALVALGALGFAGRRR